MSLIDVGIRRSWQEWGDDGRFQHHDDSGRPRAIADREDRLIVRSAVTALDSSLSTIRHATRTRLPIVTIHRRLKEIYARIDRYDTCHSHLHTVESDYSDNLA
ncbi:HTH_Tnp_Tc3_2 domain-containing protein [Trichonephila clavipes]|nr:HTH_Tnp_Tc3_2 domain-containing protein [Trichonephila clavipes]